MALDRLIGVDVGASRMKGAVVRPADGEVEGDPVRRLTPTPATPQRMAELVAEIVAELPCPGPIGVALPCLVRHGIVKKAPNLDDSWCGVDAVDLLSSATGRSVTVLNDADAAGLAEVRFGEAHQRQGTVLLLTFGTGIGSALIHDGRLVLNTEFGHMPLDDGDLAEQAAAASVREREGLTWAQWCKRVNRFLEVVAFVVQPDLIIVGGWGQRARKAAALDRAVAGRRSSYSRKAGQPGGNDRGGAAGGRRVGAGRRRGQHYTRR